MSRTINPIEFTSFSKGLITDSSPLNSQPDSASSMTNMKLLRDGTVRRRVGLKRLDYSAYSSHQMFSDSFEGVYSWEGAGEDGLTNIIVVKYLRNSSAHLTFYKVNSSGTVDHIPCSTTINGTLAPAFYDEGVVGFDVASYGNRLAYSSDKTNSVSTIKYKGDRVYISSDSPLLVRDFWGVEDFDIVTGKDLTKGDGVSYRPSVISTNQYTGNHLYNLRNQGWNKAYPNFDQEVLTDPLYGTKTTYAVAFEDHRGASNADVLADWVYPNTSSSGSRTVDRFHYKDYQTSSPTNFRAPMGSVIIDLYNRGGSRTNYLDSWGDDLALTGSAAPVNTLFTDSSTGGATALSSGFGRIWYGGFKVKSIIGDGSTTPRLQQFVAFSQLTTSDSAVTQCYQSADPTDKDSPDLVATDGGLIEVSDALNINKLLLFKNSMLVLASNGVWAITGEDNGYFSATSYRVSKVSEYGCVSPNSVVKVDNSVLYLSGDGVVALAGNEVGDLSSQIISENIISGLYNELSSSDLAKAGGSYNKKAGEVSWIIPTQNGSTNLILNTNINAFYTYSYTGDVKVLSQIALPSEQSIQIEDNVVVGADQVVVGGEPVVLERLESSQASNSRLYLIQQGIRLGFAVDNPSSFNDWEDFTATSGWTAEDPVDASAYLVTSALIGGDTQRYKQVSYLTMLFEKTEDGFELDDIGDYQVTGESSCLVQSQWDWTNSSRSNRWGRQFQAYRHKRHYFPEDLADQYEDGHSVLVSKNKLRGKGRALSLKMSSEPNKDLHILGWSMNMGITDAV
jgi:hypothetical protein